MYGPLTAGPGFRGNGRINRDGGARGPARGSGSGDSGGGARCRTVAAGRGVRVRELRRRGSLREPASPCSAAALPL
jgi:hypothetical protein